MHVLFRADASAEIGAGHIMRCLALAQHAQEEEDTEDVVRVVCKTTAPYRR